jgi:hypothetical protein
MNHVFPVARKVDEHSAIASPRCILFVRQFECPDDWKRMDMQPGFQSQADGCAIAVNQ